MGNTLADTIYAFKRKYKLVRTLGKKSGKKINKDSVYKCVASTIFRI